MSHVSLYIYCNNGKNFLRSRSGSIEAVIDTTEKNQDSYTLTPPPDSEHVWRWIDDKWVADEPEPIPIEQLQNEVWEGIKSKRLKAIKSGVYVESVDKVFHTDDVSAIQYSTIAGMIALGNYEPIQWKVMDNTWVLLTKELFIELQKAMNANTQATYAIAEQHKEAMMLLDNPSKYDF